jgi:chemotaxis regulatin CheY-phosphate phosphatase CheZ
MTKKYDKIHQELMDLILSGDLHTSLIGMMISADHSDSKDSIKEAEQFVEYIVDLLKKAEKRAKDVKVKG